MLLEVLVVGLGVLLLFALLLYCASILVGHKLCLLSMASIARLGVKTAVGHCE